MLEKILTFNFSDAAEKEVLTSDFSTELTTTEEVEKEAPTKNEPG